MSMIFVCVCVFTRFVVLGLVVPLVGAYLVRGEIDGSEGEYEMRAEVRVDVRRRELGRLGAILRPVGHIAHELIGAERGWLRQRQKRQRAVAATEGDVKCIRRRFCCDKCTEKSEYDGGGGGGGARGRHSCARGFRAITDYCLLGCCRRNAMMNTMRERVKLLPFAS